MNRSSSSLRPLNVIQMIVEACVAVGYFVGLFPFAYLWTSGWVVPLVIVSIILGLVNSNGTTVLSVINLVLAALSFIPLLGIIARLAGMVVSLLNISIIRRSL
jgi:hypothetical protein